MKHSVHTLVFRSLKRTHDMFLAQEGQPIPEDDLAYVVFYITPPCPCTCILTCTSYTCIYENSCFCGCVGMLCSLKAKVACKVLSEHYQVKDLPPPNETVAKMTMKTAPTSAKPGTCTCMTLGCSELSCVRVCTYTCIHMYRYIQCIDLHCTCIWLKLQSNRYVERSMLHK